MTGPRRWWAVVLLLSIALIVPRDPNASRAASVDADLADASVDSNEDIATAIERDKRTLPRLAPETGYVVADDAFWGYYSSRGGALTFGRPISRAFRFRGTEVQLFERGALKKLPDRSVTVLNLL